MILVSSVGADSGSKYFYTRMKGLLEEAIKDLEFETFHIIRPSLLLGNRMEFRLGEYLSKCIMGPLAFRLLENGAFLLITSSTLINGSEESLHLWKKALISLIHNSESVRTIKYEKSDTFLSCQWFPGRNLQRTSKFNRWRYPRSPQYYREADS